MASSSAFAELLIDPVSSLQAHQSSLGLSFSKSKIDYDLGKNYEVERKIVGFYGQFAMKDALAAFAHFGVISDVEYERIEGDGDGHMIGVGLRGTAYRQDKLDIIAFGTVNMIDEKISDIKKISGLSVEGAGIKFKSNLTELEAGALATYHTTPTFQVYGGLAMVPYSDGDSKFSGGFVGKNDI